MSDENVKYITKYQLLAIITIIAYPAIMFVCEYMDGVYSEEKMYTLLLGQVVLAIFALLCFGSIVNSRKRKKDPTPLIAKNVLWISVPFVIVPAAAGLGTLREYDAMGLSVVMSCVLFSVIAVCYMINLIACKVMEKKSSRETVNEANTRVIHAASVVRGDIRAAKRKLKAAFCTAGIYRAFIAAVLFAYFFFHAYCSGRLFYVEYTLWIFVMTDFFAPALNKIIVPDTIPNANELSAEKFPIIYGLAEDAMKSVGVSGDIHIYYASDNLNYTAVTFNNKSIHIMLGAMAVCFSTDKELKSTFLHEFAHVKHEDYAQSRLFNSKLCKYISDTSLLPFTGKILLRFPALMLYLDTTYYNAFVSRENERVADAEATANCDPQDFINALAKMYAIQAADNAGVSERTTFNLFESEKPVHNCIERFTEAYSGFIRDNEEKIRYLLDNEIPNPTASHPTFRERKEAAGVRDYSLFGMDENAEYTAEKNKFIETEDQDFCRIEDDIYADERYDIYTSRKELIDKAYAAEDISIYPVHERMYMAYALSTIDDEKQMEILNSILSENENDSYALSCMVKTLERNDDDTCTELLYRIAASNDNMIESCSDRLLSFAYTHGRADLVEKYEPLLFELMQKRNDKQTDFDFDAKSVIVPNDLPADVRKEVENELISIAGEYLIGLYSVKKLNKSGNHMYVYLFEFNEKGNESDRERAYGKAFMYLDRREEHFMLIDTRSLETIAYVTAKVPDCEIDMHKNESA